MSQFNTRSLLKTTSVSAALAAALAVTPLATQADQGANPFALTDIQGSTQLLASGKCGAGKCGGDAKKAEGKCGAGKCGGTKKAEGKCGAGKCGGDAKKAEGKCGAGKCGGDKAKKKESKGYSDYDY